MKKYLKFGVLSFVVLVSIFFCGKAEHNKLQNVILLNNVEALAAGENPTTMCICIIHYTNDTFVTCYDSRIRR